MRLQGRLGTILGGVGVALGLVILACRTSAPAPDPPVRQENDTYLPMPTATPFGGPVVVQPGGAEKFETMRTATPFGGPVASQPNPTFLTMPTAAPPFGGQPPARPPAPTEVPPTPTHHPV